MARFMLHAHGPPPPDDTHDDFKPKVKESVSPVHDQINKDIKSNNVRLRP